MGTKKQRYNGQTDDWEAGTMELWDVYNYDRTKSGRTMVRGDKMEGGAYHLVVHACIFNSRGEMLIQQRQPFKQGWSNMWDITVERS